jgi:thiol:disulfide interchange protein DsbD
VVVALALGALGLLWRHYHGAALSKQTTWEDMVAEARRGGYRVITTRELADLCRQPPPGLLLVDTRSDWEYSTAPLQVAAIPEYAPGPLSGWALLWKILGVFVGGMALNLTPCVYPLIPLTISCFGGREVRSRGELIIHGLLYLGGLSLTNSILGVIAALTGGLMGAMLQSPWVLVGVAAILVFFASSLFGFWELRLPAALTRAAARSFAGYFGSLFMGLTLGVVAAPCIGPFVLGLLAWVASQGSARLGFVVFFALSLGLGLPLFFLAIFSGSLEWLPRSGEWLLWVRKLMGWVLVGMAAYFVGPVLPKAARVILPAAVALTAGLHLGWLDRTTACFRGFKALKAGAGLAGLAIAAALLGSLLLAGPGVTWEPYSERLLAEAREKQKAVVLDFYATWCTPCREMEEITFHHPEVVNLAARDFSMVRVDITRQDPVNQRVLREFAVKGVPTIIFLDRRGKERKDLRVTGYLPPEEFLKRLAAAKNGSGG